MNIKTNLLEEYVNFVDNTKKQNKYFKILLILFVIVLYLFLFLGFFKFHFKIVFVQLQKKTNRIIHVIIQN